MFCRRGVCGGGDVVFEKLTANCLDETLELIHWGSMGKLMLEQAYSRAV